MANYREKDRQGLQMLHFNKQKTLAKIVIKKPKRNSYCITPTLEEKSQTIFSISPENRKELQQKHNDFPDFGECKKNRKQNHEPQESKFLTTIVVQSRKIIALSGDTESKSHSQY